MNELLAYLWQSNVELSLLLAVILTARFAIRKTTKNYNAYLLWLSIPVGLGLAKLISYLNFSEPPAEAVSYLINSYVVKPSQSFDSWNYLIFLWLGVSFLLVLRLLRQHHALRRDLRQINVPHKLSIKSKYPIVGINKEGFSPAVYGFIQPKIYFPVQLKETLSQEQIGLIIQHEEHHISQKHLWLNLLWDLLVCLVWFNPLIYISRQNFRHDQEVYCDYLVLNRAPEPEHKTYGHALLSTVSATHSVSLLCSWKMFNQLEERIMSIKNVKKTSNKIALALGSLAIVGCTSLYAVNKNGAKQLAEDTEHRIEWSIGGKSYVQEGEQWMLYENGSKRPMTEQEKREFEEAQRHVEEEMRKAEKEMLRAEQEMANVEREIEKAMMEMEKAHKEIAVSHEEMKEVFVDLELSQMKVHEEYLEGKISKEQFERAQAEFRKAQEQLKKDRSHHQRDMQRAKEELEKARRLLEKQRSEMKPPKAPKAPKEPKAVSVPKAPKEPETPKATS